MARTCCSNCEVADASSVAWPLLWTRGASSLTASVPSQQEEHLDSQEADEVHGHGKGLGDLAGDERTTPASTGAGRRLSTRMPASWRLAAGG